MERRTGRRSRPLSALAPTRSAAKSGSHRVDRASGKVRGASRKTGFLSTWRNAMLSRASGNLRGRSYEVEPCRQYESAGETTTTQTRTLNPSPPRSAQQLYTITMRDSDGPGSPTKCCTGQRVKCVRWPLLDVACCSNVVVLHNLRTLDLPG